MPHDMRFSLSLSPRSAAARSPTTGTEVVPRDSDSRSRWESNLPNEFPSELARPRENFPLARREASPLREKIYIYIYVAIFPSRLRATDVPEIGRRARARARR